MSAGNDRLLRSIEAHLRAALAHGAEQAVIGGFTAFFWPTPDPFYRNAAVPLHGAVHAAPAIAALGAAFAARGLSPRIELVEELHPRTAATLRAAGFREERMPAMVLGSWVAPEALAAIELLDPVLGEAGMAAHLRLLDLGMGGEGNVAAGEARNLLRDIAQGRSRVAVHRELGRVVGSATLVREGEVAELLAVWTDPAWRRRGIARRLCSALLADWLTVPGRLAWLGAASEGARLLYEGLGFQPVGTHAAFVRAR
jgi:ribosomal protein S18 acetylase RimI-like enzyme